MIWRAAPRGGGGTEKYPYPGRASGKRHADHSSAARADASLHVMYLLDTHSFLWFIWNDPRLSAGDPFERTLISQSIEEGLTLIFKTPKVCAVQH